MKFIIGEMKFESSVKEKDHQTHTSSDIAYVLFESSVKEKDHQTNECFDFGRISLRAV